MKRYPVYLVSTVILLACSSVGVALSLWLTGNWMPGLPLGVIAGLALGAVVVAVRRRRDLSA